MRQPYPKAFYVEVALVLGCMPFLLFPTLWPVLTATALLIVAFIWLWGRRLLPASPINPFMLLWLIMVGVGILVSVDPQWTLPKATGLILGATIWRLLMVYGAGRWAWYGFFLFGVGIIGVGVWTVDFPQKVPALASLVRWLPSASDWLPESPTAGIQANQLVAVLLLYLPLSWLLFLTEKKTYKLLWGGLACVLFVLLLLTQSRGGWLGGFAGMAIVLFIWIRQKLRERQRHWLDYAVFSSLVTGGVLCVWFLPAIWSHLIVQAPSGTPLGNFASLRFRQETWYWSVQAIQDFPLTGVGLGSFREVVRRLYPLQVRPDLDIAHAHNIFLQVALDTGLVGLVAYLGILVTVFYLGWRKGQVDPSSRPLIWGLLIGLVAFHIYGLVDALAPGAKPGLVFWWVIGLLSVRKTSEV